MSDLETRVSNLEKRNTIVDKNKKWENSNTRKIVIMCLTYFTLGLYMFFLGIDKWYLHSLIPTFGFFISTLTLEFIKNIWDTKFNSK
jgi:hypothetical protein